MLLLRGHTNTQGMRRPAGPSSVSMPINSSTSSSISIMTRNPNPRRDHNSCKIWASPLVGLNTVFNSRTGNRGIAG